MTRSFTRVAATVLCLGFGLSSPLFAQRADRATVSGVVSDPQGSAVPGATVTVRNEGTGIESVMVTNAAGAYATPPLVLGTYSVSVDLTGFKKSVTSGILLQGGDQVRHDVTMQVGALTETVEVTGQTGGLSDTRPDVAHTVNEKYYRDLPIVTASDVRLAEAVLQMQPGYLPMRPNGEPMFRGSQFNSRINGGQARATENVFDGAAFGYAVGHQGSHESTPPVEAIQEVKVITTSYSAQYGHTSGGFIEYTVQVGDELAAGKRLRVLRARRAQRQGVLRGRKDTAAERQFRRRAGRAGRPEEPVQRPQQDVLLHELRLHAHPVRRAARVRQHDACRCVQGRRLRPASHRDTGRRGCTRTADSERADFQPRDDAPGQRRARARSLSEQLHPG